MNLTYNHIKQKLFYNDLTFSTMLFRYLIIPWILIDGFILAWLIAFIGSANTLFIAFLIYFIIPLVFIYLTIINLALIRKTFIIQSNFKKTLAFILLNICTFISAIGTFISIGVVIMKIFK